MDGRSIALNVSNANEPKIHWLAVVENGSVLGRKTGSPWQHRVYYIFRVITIGFILFSPFRYHIIYIFMSSSLCPFGVSAVFCVLLHSCRVSIHVWVQTWLHVYLIALNLLNKQRKQKNTSIFTKRNEMQSFGVDELDFSLVRSVCICTLYECSSIVFRSSTVWLFVPPICTHKWFTQAIKSGYLWCMQITLSVSIFSSFLALSLFKTHRFFSLHRNVLVLSVIHVLIPISYDLCTCCSFISACVFSVWVYAARLYTRSGAPTNSKSFEENHFAAATK